MSNLLWQALHRSSPLRRVKKPPSTARTVTPLDPPEPLLPIAIAPLPVKHVTRKGMAEFHSGTVGIVWKKAKCSWEVRLSRNGIVHRAGTHRSLAAAEDAMVHLKKRLGLYDKHI